MLELVKAERARRAAEAERQRVRNDAELTRARCTTLAGFVREAWKVLEPGRPYVHGWHIDAICEHLEAITRGDITRLLVNVPPGTMKSLLVSVFWPAWEWGPKGLAHLQYLTTSYSENYAKRDARRMRDLVSSEWYRALWPEVELTRAGEMSFANGKRGGREAMPFASLTGGRGDRVIIDDPHSTETAESEADRERTTRIFRESVPTRLNDAQTSAIVVIMQRLHERDVSGVALSLKLGYEHLMLPMEFEPERRCRTSIGFEDPRTSERELLFPERFPRATLDRDYQALGQYAVAGQMQQRPAPREGGLFKRSWFPIVDSAPLHGNRCRAWDLAGTKKASNNPDWTAGVRVVQGDDGFFYIEHIHRVQDTPGNVERDIKSFADTDPPGTTIRLPQDPGQAGKAQAGSFVLALAGRDVKVQTVTGDKSTRATPAARLAENGFVRLVRGTWNDAFLDEICSFPGGAHDDQVDAFADAVNEIALGGSAQGWIEYYRELAEKVGTDHPAVPAAMVANEAPKPEPEVIALVDLRAPPNVSSLSLSTGRTYPVNAERIVSVRQEDVEALLRAGCARL